MMIKTIFRVLLFSFFMIVLISCDDKQDYGYIKNFYIQNEIIYWDDVEDAKFYEVTYYYDDEQSNKDNLLYGKEITYISQTKSNNQYMYPGFKITIRTHYEDNHTEESHFITLYYKRIEDSSPRWITYLPFESNAIYWDIPDNIETIVDFTVLVNGNEYNVTENEFYIEEHLSNSEIDNTLLKIQVKTNYQDGSSQFSNVFYGFFHFMNSIELNKIELGYNPNINDDVIHRFTQGEISTIVYMNPLSDLIEELPQGAFHINDSQIILNKYFLENLNSDIYIITIDNVYAISMTNLLV